jgi:hypothetical protein
MGSGIGGLLDGASHIKLGGTTAIVGKYRDNQPPTLRGNARNATVGLTKNNAGNVSTMARHAAIMTSGLGNQARQRGEVCPLETGMVEINRAVEHGNADTVIT